MSRRVVATAALLLAAATAHAELPVEVQRDLWKDYGSPRVATRYREARVDLDGNGREDIVILLNGKRACSRAGCPTLVYAPEGKDGWRRVATIAATQAPIGVAAARNAGWRDLVVHVRGSRTASPIVELSFDGGTYPANAAAKNPFVKPTEQAGDVLIGATDAANAGEMLTLPPETGIADTVDAESVKATRKISARHGKAAAKGPDAPSFNCGLAMANSEKLICDTPELAALDREVAGELAKMLKGQPEDRETELNSEQHIWTTTRNACATSADAVGCVRTAYRQRLVALKIQQGLATVSSTRTYDCKNQRTPLVAAFYAETDPKAVALTWGKSKAVLYADGARYADGLFEFREDNGKVVSKWHRLTLNCTLRP